MYLGASAVQELRHIHARIIKHKHTRDADDNLFSLLLADFSCEIQFSTTTSDESTTIVRNDDDDKFFDFFLQQQ
jgi:hypothetical protein